MKLTPWALRQACRKLDIPEDYILRSPPDIQAYNLNHGLQNCDDTWLLRRRGRLVRGIVSPRYSPFSHVEVLEAVAIGLGSTRVSIQHAHVDDELLYIVISLDDYRHPIGWTFDDKQDWHVPTLCVINSEVGLRRVTVSLGIWRQVCSNGLIGFSEYQINRIHVGIKRDQLRSEIGARIADALEQAPAVVGRLQSAKNVKFANPEEVIRQVARRARMSAPLIDAVLDAYRRAPDPTHFGIIQAFTAVARRLPPNDRLELEQFAGRLLNEPPPRAA